MVLIWRARAMDIYAQSGIVNPDADFEGSNWRRTLVCSTPCMRAFRARPRNNEGFFSKHYGREPGHRHRHRRASLSLMETRWIKYRRLTKSKPFSSQSLVRFHPVHCCLTTARVLNAHRLTKVQTLRTLCFEAQAPETNGQDHRSGRRRHRRQFC